MENMEIQEVLFEDEEEEEVKPKIEVSKNNWMTATQIIKETIIRKIYEIKR